VVLETRLQVNRQQQRSLHLLLVEVLQQHLVEVLVPIMPQVNPRQERQLLQHLVLEVLLVSQQQRQVPQRLHLGLNLRLGRKLLQDLLLP